MPTDSRRKLRPWIIASALHGTHLQGYERLSVLGQGAMLGAQNMPVLPSNSVEPHIASFTLPAAPPLKTTSLDPVVRWSSLICLKWHIILVIRSI